MQIIKGKIAEGKISTDGNFFVVIRDGKRQFPANNMYLEGYWNEEVSDSLHYELRKNGKLVKDYGGAENGSYDKTVAFKHELGKKAFRPVIPDFEDHDGAKFHFVTEEADDGSVIMTVTKEKT